MIEKLLSVGSDALGTNDRSGVHMLRKFGRIGDELARMLESKNGWYAFESALHVFPMGSAGDTVDGVRWNAPDLWKCDYGAIPDIYCFAEDIFGDQFCIHNDTICTFESETGAVEYMADGIEQWCAMILDDYHVLTGYPIAHEWQAMHGALQEGNRLLPIVPFVGGGEFSVTNLRSVDAIEAMKYRGAIARLIRDLPDGTTFSIDVVE